MDMLKSQSAKMEARTLTVEERVGWQGIGGSSAPKAGDAQTP